MSLRRRPSKRLSGRRGSARRRRRLPRRGSDQQRFVDLVSNGLERLPPAQTFHNKWFMDNVQPGTKVLFASECAKPSKKHPNDTVRCTFWFPDPDSTDHEYATQGRSPEESLMPTTRGNSASRRMVGTSMGLANMGML